MLEVIQQQDGRFAVREIGGPLLENVLGVFDTQEEADEWLLSEEMVRGARSSGLGLLKPGGGQGLG